MLISRYIDVKTFLDEAKALRVTNSQLTDAVLERLEQQRSLLPRLRLHYPDTIERRWWAEANEGYAVCGELEPDGPRLAAAQALEAARYARNLEVDPTTVTNLLDDPEERFLQFMERPADQPFVPWQDYRVAVSADGAPPLYTSNTVVTFYSSWQLLQFVEVVNMGVTSLMNLVALKEWPSAEDIAAAPRTISFTPIQAIRGFEEHADALDAMIWYSEEAQNGFEYATRRGIGRRTMSEAEVAEIQRTRLWASEQARLRHHIDEEALLAANRFLFEQWSHWEREGRPLISAAYKMVAAQGVRLACLIGDKSVDEYRSLVGLAGGYVEPILDVIWPRWAVEQRDNVRRVLVSYRREGSLLRADLSDELVDRFLDFIEAEGLQGFYWRMESFNRHSFKGNEYAVEGLKSDVQGMAVIVEHIASALGGKGDQLREKFKHLWRSNPNVVKLLKNNEVMKVGNGKGIDLQWFEQRNGLSPPEQIAADLAITYAIRGGAHRMIEEDNPLKLERMMLILLRAAVRTFAAAT